KRLKALRIFSAQYNIPRTLPPEHKHVSFKDSSVVRYATRRQRDIVKGKLSVIEGMKTKVLVWVKVTGITAKDAYEMPRDAIRVEQY
ncbi:hypothetical protein CUMW_284950, partial [Citrus unshiu]